MYLVMGFTPIRNSFITLKTSSPSKPHYPLNPTHQATVRKFLPATKTTQTKPVSPRECEYHKFSYFVQQLSLPSSTDLWRTKIFQDEGRTISINIFPGSMRKKMRAVRSKKIMKERGDAFELGITVQETHRGSQIRQGILAREDDDGKNSWLVTKLPRIAHKIMMKCMPGMDTSSNKEKITTTSAYYWRQREY